MDEAQRYVRKHSQVIPVAKTLQDEADEFRRSWDAWMSLTPEERAALSAADEIRVKAQRAAEREAAPRIELTVDTLAAKLGWSREYAEHFVQPYCECSEDREGDWYYCSHACDLGLER